MVDLRRAKERFEFCYSLRAILSQELNTNAADKLTITGVKAMLFYHGSYLHVDYSVAIAITAERETGEQVYLTGLSGFIGKFGAGYAVTEAGRANLARALISAFASAKEVTSEDFQRFCSPKG